MEKYQKIIIFVLLLVFLAVGSFGCKGKEATGTANAENTPKAVPVETVKAEIGKLTQFTILSGVTEPTSNINIMPKISGLEEVIAINVHEGDQVQKGQSIAVLDQSTAEIQLNSAQITYDDALKNFERNKILLEMGAISQTSFEQISTALKNAENNLKAQKIAFNNNVIKSPIKGIVTRLEIEEGAMITAQTLVAEITDLSKVVINTSINEMQINHLSKGDIVNVLVPALNNKIYTGQIIFVSSVMDNNIKAFPIKIELDNPKNEIKAGMYAEVELITGTSQGTVILPRRAVIFEDGKGFVYTVMDGTAFRKEVSTGISTGKQIEVLDGVAEGEEIVVNGNDRLVDGDLVEVTERGASE